jgi:uncharacterized protein
MPVNMSSKHRLDPRGPFILDTRDLGRRPGAMRVLVREVPAPAGLAIELVGVPEGAPLRLDLVLQSVTEGVLVTGTVSAPVRGECGRCLEPVSYDLDVEPCELFAYPDSATDETTEEDEVSRLVDDLIDLEPVVRDLVVLALPMTPLCRPDCAGLCSTCGQRLDDLPAGHTHEQLDPRWAALAAIVDGSETPAPKPAPPARPAPPRTTTDTSTSQE